MTANSPVIKFFAPVTDATIYALMNAVDQKLKEGIETLTILISSPGGSVFHGLSAYNYLKGLPIKITTHNFGSVDSIGVALFCAGSQRLSVSQARFLIHGVTLQFRGDLRLEEKFLEEKLKGLRVDTRNVAKVIAANSNRNEEEVITAMHERITLNPEEALSWGLVHEIRPELFETGSEVISIQFQPEYPPKNTHSGF